METIWKGVVNVKRVIAKSLTMFLAMILLTACVPEEDISAKPDASDSENRTAAVSKIIKTGSVEKAYAFEADGIYAGEEKVGDYAEYTPMLYISDISETFGWEMEFEDEGLELTRKGYAVRFLPESARCARQYEGQALEPVEMNRTPIFVDGDVLVYSVDLENVLGLDALWRPEENTLYLKQELYRIQKSDSEDLWSIEGERAVISLSYEHLNDKGDVFIDSELPRLSIRKDGVPFLRDASATLEPDATPGGNLVYRMEARTEPLSILQPARLQMEIKKKGRVLGSCGLTVEISEPEKQAIKIEQSGPWDLFAMYAPNALLTKAADGEIWLSGMCRYEELKVRIYAMDGEGAMTLADERPIALEGDFFEETIFLEKGLYRLEMAASDKGTVFVPAGFYADCRFGD